LQDPGFFLACTRKIILDPGLIESLSFDAVRRVVGRKMMSIKPRMAALAIPGWPSRQRPPPVKSAAWVDRYQCLQIHRMTEAGTEAVVRIAPRFRAKFGRGET
jgi:hypothetical protein